MTCFNLYWCHSVHHIEGFSFPYSFGLVLIVSPDYISIFSRVMELLLLSCYPHLLLCLRELSFRGRGRKNNIITMTAVMMASCFFASCRRGSTDTSFTPWSWCVCWNYCHVSNLPNGYGTRSTDCSGIIETLLSLN